MKHLKLFLVLCLLVSASVYSRNAVHAEGASQTLQLVNKSNVVLLNGVADTSAQPVTIKDGITYIVFSSLAKWYGYKVTYDQVNKRSVATNYNSEISFKINSNEVLVSDNTVISQGVSFLQGGSLMVPLRTWATLTNSKLSFDGTNYTLTWETKPLATFKVANDGITVGDEVQYIDQSVSPDGQAIINEEWIGKESVFYDAGTYTVTHRVQDASGQWSDPYTVTIEVMPPNQPPVASFTTDKDTYRIGEPIRYTDLSTDDGDNIVKRTYSDTKQSAYFEAGEKTITLTVVDGAGLSSTFTKTIYVTDEVLYTKDEFNQLFTPAGEKYDVNGGSILNIPTFSYDFTSEPSKMIRSNSPETFIEEGVAYDDHFEGKVRMMLHNVNKIGYNVKQYLVVTNDGYKTAKFGVGSIGTGGPDPSEINTGKMSTIRYLTALGSNTETNWTTTLKPGESKVVLNQISVLLKPNMTFSAYADVESDSMLRYRLIAIDAAVSDPLQVIDSLNLMSRDNKHVRGSFNNATRIISLVDKPLGATPQRIVLGDNKLDPNLDGIDGMTGLLELNTGNFGVVYKMQLKLAPRTLVTLNARGGHYTGAFLVNGLVVPVTSISVLKDNNEAAVLYRSGNYTETIDVMFTVASGSNLPITMIFQPLPKEKF